MVYIKKLSFLTLITLLTLTGCTSTINTSHCVDISTPLERVNRSNLDQVFKEIAKEVCASPDKIVIIPDFLDIQTLNTSSIGLLLGEVMRSSYSQICKGKIVQIEFPKHFKISKDGVISLTRNPNDLKRAELSTNEVIIGTFSYTDNKLRIFVRKVDADTGYILNMTTREINLTSCRPYY